MPSRRSASLAFTSSGNRWARLERWLHRVNVPTHVIWGIWGDGDRIIPPAYAEAFHRLIPGSTLTMIPNAGHLPHVERAAAVAQAMHTFLRN